MLQQILTQCYRSIILQKETNKQKKRSDLWLPEAGVREGELNEGDQKVQTCS